MENLQGGTLALEHRYDVESHQGRRGLVNRYRGTQQPFNKDIEILVWEVFDECRPSREVLSGIRESASAAAALNGPGIARVLDFGEVEEDVPFVVIERPNGERLSSVLEAKGMLSPEDTLDWLRSATAVLEAAHTAGVNHGGLGAHHLRVHADDYTKVSISEFGLTLSVDEVRSLENAIMDYESVGSHPPEAFEGSCEVSEANDVYALATIAYSSLAGVHPYFDDLTDTSEGLSRIQQEDPASLTDFGLSQDVADVFERALSRKRDRRFRKASAFSEALELAIQGPPKDETPEVGPPELTEESEPSIEIRPESTHLPTSPSPKATTLGMMLFVLVVSNLGWLYHSTQAQLVAEAAEPVTESELIPGLVIDTDPQAARVAIVKGDEMTELGETPLAIDPGLEGPGGMTLKITSDGREDSTLVLKPSGHGAHITLELQAPRN